jgi:predicted nucleotide-binding protein
MARRPTPPKPERPILSIEQKRRRIERLQKCIEDLKAFDPQKVQKRYRVPEVMALEADIDSALSAAFGHQTEAYNRYIDAATLDHGPHIARIAPNFGGSPRYDTEEAHDARRYFAEGKEQSIVLLGRAIHELKEEIAEEEETRLDRPISAPTTRTKPARKVFVVHGHDEGARESVARFLEKIGFEVVILHEKANQGRTVIEKVEAHSDVGFAVIVLSPDDEGCVIGETPQPRARQNVLLELGYFIGKLTRQRVCTLKVGDVEIPSDWRGVIDEPFDKGGGWKQTLARELEAAGYEIDWNKVMR